MNAEALLDGIRLFVVFVTVAALVGLAIRRVEVPYSVALVGVGLALGLVLPGLDLDITPELVLVVVLPGLVFEASFRIDLSALRRGFTSVALLAGPGVLVVAGVVAIILYLGTGLPLELGFIVGAMVAATDPAAVIATFKGLGVPRRLAAIWSSTRKTPRSSTPTSPASSNPTESRSVSRWPSIPLASTPRTCCPTPSMR